MENPHLAVVNPQVCEPIEILIFKDFQVRPSLIGFGNSRDLHIDINFATANIHQYAPISM